MAIFAEFIFSAVPYNLLALNFTEPASFQVHTFMYFRVSVLRIWIQGLYLIILVILFDSAAALQSRTKEKVVYLQRDSPNSQL